MVFFWLFNLIDAYRQAVLIKYGYRPGRGSDTQDFFQKCSGSLVLGGAIFLLGFYGLLKHLLPWLDLSFVFDFWYLPFMAFGGWLIHRALQERRPPRDDFESYEPLPPAPVFEPLPEAPAEDDEEYLEASGEQESE